ncbi:MAG TPA: cupredoxin domain-containing protein [Dehalococcoidia bacterium]|nr:cupredoxin domain-containing protein [Dehalococcoidia bacterium]
MKTKTNWPVLLLISIVLMGALALVPLSIASAGPTVREVDMKASLFAWDPPVIRVHEGDKVVLNLTSKDIVHGIYIDGYEKDVLVSPGKVTRLEFVADKTGKFKFRCSFTCGNMHPFMIGEMVVEDNVSYAGAIGVSAVAAVGALAYVWTRKEESA